jgi:excisionase family DNA binding protein
MAMTLNWAEGTRSALTRKEVAEMLSASVVTLDRWAHEGRGPRYIKVGGRALYPIAWLNEWIESRETGGES